MSFNEGSAVHATLVGLSDVGRQRSLNQDNLAICDLSRGGDEGAPARVEVGDRGVLLVVCDGMGGGQGGEVASGLATTALRRSLLALDGPRSAEGAARDLVEALDCAHAMVRGTAQRLKLRDMGTTATAALVVGDRLLVGQVGDSRAYVLRGGELRQVTRDQSLVQQMLETGCIQPHEVRDFEHSNIILQAIGTSPSILADLSSVTLRRDDIILVCSDGLWGELEDAQIAAIIDASPSLDDACRRLVEAANEAGGSDNISCILCRVDGPGLAPPSPEEPMPSYRKLVFPDATDPVAEPLPTAPTVPPIEPREPPPDAVDIPLVRPGLAEVALLLTCAAALGLGLLWCAGS